MNKQAFISGYLVKTAFVDSSDPNKILKKQKLAAKIPGNVEFGQDPVYSQRDQEAAKIQQRMAVTSTPPTPGEVESPALQVVRELGKTSSTPPPKSTHLLTPGSTEENPILKKLTGASPEETRSNINQLYNMGSWASGRWTKSVASLNPVSKDWKLGKVSGKSSERILS